MSTTDRNYVPTLLANSSSIAEDPFDYELEFLVCTGFSVPLGLGALYVAVTQVVYCVLKAKTTLPRQSKRRPSSTSSTGSSKSKSNVQGRYAFVLNTMVAFGAICAFLRAGIDFRLIFGKYNDLGCDLSIKFKLANYVFALITVYLVLWLRQRVFYQHPRLKHLSSRFIRFVSWGMSVLIVSGMIATAAIFFGVGKYIGTPNGCVVRKGPLTTIRWIILISCTTFFQICLLTLFIYPLVKHHSSVKSSGPGDKTKNPIIPLIKRATITSAVCVATDIAFAMIILVLKKEVVTMSTFIYDINIVINVLCMISSFPDWRIRLMPWRVKTMVKEGSEESTDGTSRNRTSESNLPARHSVVSAPIHENQRIL